MRGLVEKKFTQMYEAFNWVDESLALIDYPIKWILFRPYKKRGIVVCLEKFCILSLMWWFKIEMYNNVCHFSFSNDVSREHISKMYVTKKFKDENWKLNFNLKLKLIAVIKWSKNVCVEKWRQYMTTFKRLILIWHNEVNAVDFR